MYMVLVNFVPLISLKKKKKHFVPLNPARSSALTNPPKSFNKQLLKASISSLLFINYLLLLFILRLKNHVEAGADVHVLLWVGPHPHENLKTVIRSKFSSYLHPYVCVLLEGLVSLQALVRYFMTRSLSPTSEKINTQLTLCTTRWGWPNNSTIYSLCPPPTAQLEESSRKSPAVCACMHVRCTLGHRNFGLSEYFSVAAYMQRQPCIRFL